VPNLLPSHAKAKNRKQSKKPSLAEILIPQQPTQPPLQKLPTFNGNYHDLPSSKERIKHARNFLLQILDEYQDCDDEEMMETITEEFIQAQKMKGLSEDECQSLTIKCFSNQFVAKNRIDTAKVFKSFWKTGLSYVDYTTDIMVFIQLIQSTKHVGLAVAQGISIVFSLLCQCICSLALGQPLWVGICGLLGLKPLIEGYRDAVDSKPFPGQKLNNELMLLLTRMTEITAEAIPQSIIQSIILLLTSPANRTTLQYFSLFSSFLTTAITVAFADKEIDTSKYRRKTDPLLFGYVPGKEFATKQLATFITFLTSYGIAKTMSLAILFIATPAYISVGWLAMEWFGLLVWRMSYGNWRVYRNGADGTVFSLLCHLFYYLCLLSAPFPIIRMPAFLTPRIYSGGIIYMVVSNFLMVVVSYHATHHTFNPPIHFPESTALILLFTSTLISIISGIIFFHYIPKSHRKTFHEQKTLKEHVATYWWNDKTYDNDHKHRDVDTNEGVRALLPTWLSIHYLPKEKLIEHYRIHWETWVADPPDWFDADYRAMIPRELLVDVPENLWEEVEVKEIERVE